MTAFEWFVGLRYTRSARVAGRGGGFISFIAALGVAGIAWGVLHGAPLNLTQILAGNQGLTACWRRCRSCGW